MTLVLALIGPHSVWLAADRRLTDRGRVVRDDAGKIMFLETTDAVSILGYAGLGATARGTQPAEWMSSVLRGRNWPLEPSLGTLATAMKRELPPHLAQLRQLHGPSHNLIVAAFVEQQPRLYSIDVALSADRKQLAFRHTRWVISTADPRPRTPRLAIAGSGAVLLAHEHGWQRPLLRLQRAYDDNRVSSRTVTKALADVNYDVSRRLTDGTVGERCIVAWRHRKASRHKGNPGHQCFTGVTPDPNSPSLPTIANGMDVHALVQVMMPHTMKQFEAMREGKPGELDTEALNADLATLPEGPDELLH